MSQARLSERELLTLIEGACNASLAPIDVSRLEMALRNDASARELYQAYMLLDAELYWRQVGTADASQWSVDLLGEVTEDKSVVVSLDDYREVDTVLSPEAVSARRSSRGFFNADPKPHARSADRSLGVNRWIEGVLCGVRSYFAKLSLKMFVLVLAGTGVFWTVLIVALSPYLSQRFNEMAIPPTQRPEHHATVAGEVVAVLASAANCRWQIPSRPLLDGSSLGPEKLELLSGTAELVFGDGARVILEGPASFTTQDAGRAMLERGRLAARVPPRARGFTIVTPTVEVVDLGTEFGVNVSKQGVVEVAVLAGKVEIGNPPSRLGSRHQSENKRQIISAGQVVTVRRSEAGQLTIDHAEFDDTVAVSLSKQLRKSIPRPSAKVVAYRVTDGTAGNQRDFHGGVGLDFEVQVPIRIYSLGVFDHLGDGIDQATSPTVQLWSRDTRDTPDNTSDDIGREVLTSQSFGTGNSGKLKLGHRFKSLSEPIELPVGSYSIVAYGLVATNPFITFENTVKDANFGSDLGWIGSNNTTGGNNYGWSSSTNLAGGSIGEVGGIFARAQVDSFYGDVHLSSTLDLGRSITACGKFNIRNITEGWTASGDSGFFIGHFSQDVNRPEFIGLEFKEENITSNMRVRARLQVSTDGNDTGAESEWRHVSIHDNHNFSYAYDPSAGNGRLTLNIDAMPPFVADLKPTERDTGAQFDAFGIGATSNLNSENDPAKTAEVYLDDASYSGSRGGEPPLASLVELRKPTQVRVETCGDAIAPIGSRYGEGRPGTFPRIRGDRLTAYAAGSFEYLPSIGEGKGQSVDK
jgi:hypothetical protein